MVVVNRYHCKNGGSICNNVNMLHSLWKTAHIFWFLHLKEINLISLNRNQMGHYVKFQNLKMQKFSSLLCRWIILPQYQCVTILMSKFLKLVNKMVLYVKMIVKQQKVFLTKILSSSFRLWYLSSLAPNTVGTSLTSFEFTLLASFESKSVTWDSIYVCSLLILSHYFEHLKINTLLVKQKDFQWLE